MSNPLPAACTAVVSGNEDCCLCLLELSADIWNDKGVAWLAEASRPEGCVLAETVDLVSEDGFGRGKDCLDTVDRVCGSLLRRLASRKTLLSLLGSARASR